MTDPFKTHSTGMSDPVNAASSIFPSDTVDLAVTTRAVFVGVGGSLRVTLSSGDIVTFSNAAGGWHPLRVTRVWATGTTASEIVGCH